MTVDVRLLSRAEAEEHEAGIERLVALIGGVCVHPPGELVRAERFQNLRYDISHAAWRGSEMVGVLLACRWSAEQADADHARLAGELQTPAAGGGYRYRRPSFALDHLAVRADAQGQGIGSRLLDAWLHVTADLAAERGPATAHWSLETRADEGDGRAHRLYTRHGFQIVGERWYGPERDLVMWRSRRIPGRRT